MTYRARLDEDGCIDLLRILQVVNQIDQEQAWAICYELCTLMKRLASRSSSSNGNNNNNNNIDEDARGRTSPPPALNCAPIESLSQLHIHKDGYVHEKSCQVATGSWLQHQHHHKQQQQQLKRTSVASPSSPTSSSSSSRSQSQSPSATSSSSPTSSQHDEDEDNQDQDHHEDHNEEELTGRSCSSPELLAEILKRRPALNEAELVASLGIALFWALDYGIPNDEERKLSISMEYLIFQSQNELTFEQVLELCEKRLPPATRPRAEAHYRSLCKSLVQDTIQLSIFLEKIYTASMVLSDISEKELSELGEPLASLRALRIDDWARLWMHVIKELKQALEIT